MPDRVLLRDGTPGARVESDAFTGELPVFVARGADARLAEDGVLLREGLDVALVRAGALVQEMPLYRAHADGRVARVRVARIETRALSA